MKKQARAGLHERLVQMGGAHDPRGDGDNYYWRWEVGKEFIGPKYWELVVKLDEKGNSVQGVWLINTVRRGLPSEQLELAIRDTSSILLVIAGLKGEK